MLTGDVLDPGEVYLAGTLQEGACYRDALAHWSSPNAAVAGFDCYFDNSNAKIRPTDGRLLYTNSFELREFHCDGCPYMGSYPAAPLANDTVLPTPPCISNGAYLSGFLVSPSGAVLHTCIQAQGAWYDEFGMTVYSDPQDKLLHLGYGNLALTQSRVVNLGTATSAPIKGLPATARYTARAVPPDKFLVVIAAAQSKPDGSAQELWQIDANGTATMVGVFPPLPAEAKSVQAWSSKLDGNGALLQFGDGLMVFEDVIVRRQVGAASAVVYDEVTNPLVKIHISALVTGP